MGSAGGGVARLWWWLGAGFAVLGLGMCLWRGVWPALQPGWSRDLVVIYGGVRAWWEGSDPYALEVALAALRAGGGAWTMESWRYLILYPPSMMVLLSPLGAMGFREAVWVVWAGNVAATAAIVAGLLRLTGLGFRSAAGLALVGFVLAMAPTHTSFRMGQVTLPAVALVVWFLVLESRGRFVWSGVLLGLGMALKPQMAGLFVLWLAYRRRWGGTAAALGVSLGLLGLGALRIEMTGADWWSGWRENVAVFGEGGKGDPRPSVNDSAYQLVNLESAVHGLGSFGLNAVRMGAWVLLGAVGCAIWWWAARAGRRPGDRLLVAGALGLVSLLAVYHRAYDAVLAVFALGWAASAAMGCAQAGPPGRDVARERGLGWAVLVMLGTLLIPWGPVAHAVVGPRLPAGLREGALWVGVVTPMQAWSMLGSLLVLAWVMWRRSRRSAAERV